MDHNFWLDRWQKQEIGFHNLSVQLALQKFWPRLGLAPDAAVLVPLAGKSLDMAWLTEQGHTVVGVELSERAVDEFFAEHGVTPDVRTVGDYIVKSSGRITLWCGDFFKLNASELPRIGALYDRAALVAMPPIMQSGYAAKLGELLPAGTPGLLIGLDYNTKEMNGPPFAISQSRVQELLAANFTIECLEARDGLTKSVHLAKRGVTRLEEASYLLKRRA